MHKKGAGEVVSKRRKVRKATQASRGVFGASLDEIKRKREQSKGLRSAMREKTLRCVELRHQRSEPAIKNNNAYIQLSEVPWT
eukprot:SAG11_NODE_115_length_16019_cov_12.462940_8_plen_83_part_00